MDRITLAEGNGEGGVDAQGQGLGLFNVSTAQ